MGFVQIVTDITSVMIKIPRHPEISIKPLNFSDLREFGKPSARK